MNNKKTFQKISGELAWNIILQAKVSRDFNMMVTAQSPAAAFFTSLRANNSSGKNHKTQT